MVASTLLDYFLDYYLDKEIAIDHLDGVNNSSCEGHQGVQLGMCDADSARRGAARAALRWCSWEGARRVRRGACAVRPSARNTM